MMPESYRVALKMGILVTGKEMYLANFYMWVELALQRTKSMSGHRKEERGFWSENTKAFVPFGRGDASDGVPPAPLPCTVMGGRRPGLFLAVLAKLIHISITQNG